MGQTDENVGEQGSLGGQGLDNNNSACSSTSSSNNNSKLTTPTKEDKGEKNLFDGDSGLCEENNLEMSSNHSMESSQNLASGRGMCEDVQLCDAGVPTSLSQDQLCEQISERSQGLLNVDNHITEEISCDTEGEEVGHSRGRDHDRKRTFGLGLTFGFPKVFLHQRSASQASTSTERLLLNNQMSPGSIMSKSSSESNIPMCHNSLDNLMDDFPSSRSTDSSYILTNSEFPKDIESQIRPRNRREDHEDSQSECAIQNSDFASTFVEGMEGITDTSSEEASTRPSLNNNASCAGQSQPRSIYRNENTWDAGENLNKMDFTLSVSPGSLPSSSFQGESRSVGPKFKLVAEGDIQVCKVKHGQNLMNKLTSSKLLRRWETHHLYLNDSCISSKTPIGSLTTPIAYWQMEEVYVVVRWDSGRRYILRIVLPDGSLLLQGSNAYVRDQWYHSIIWKKNIFKYHNLMRSSKRPEVILKELKSLVDFATVTPLQDDCISHVPVEIVSNLLDTAGDLLGKTLAEEVLVALSPLLERSHPPPSLCRFFSRHCRTRPRCPLVGQLFTPVVRRALKHNVDFGKYPYMRRFIQDYIQALYCHNDGINVVRNFVKR